MSRFSFSEKKTTQLAAALIERSGGSLNHMKLIKLMYMADRAALLRWERPITGDDYFSLRHGPILSATLTMISDGQDPSCERFWSEYIEKSGSYEVSLLKPCPPNDLSQAEENVIGEIFDKYGHYDKWELVKHLHEVLPEWKNPGNSSFPIDIESILKYEGWSEQEISDMDAELESVNAAKDLFGYR